MGLLNVAESAAEGAVMGGPAGGAIGAVKGFAQSISLKQVLGFAAGIALLCLVGWAARLNSRLHERDAQIEAAAQAIQQVEGKKTSAPFLAAWIFKIAAERDDAKAADALKKTALDSQTQTIQNLSAVSSQQAAVSKQNVDLAKALVVSRDNWIGQAQANANRATPLPDNQELAQCKEALDALYQNNF